MNSALTIVIVSALATGFSFNADATTAELFTKAHTRLHVQGWRADLGAHSDLPEYSGLERKLVAAGYDAVDFCSVGAAGCILQYTRRKECLRLRVQDEDLATMKVMGSSTECRDTESPANATALPPDARYFLQWRQECDSDGECDGIDTFRAKLIRKYAKNTRVLTALSLMPE